MTAVYCYLSEGRFHKVIREHVPVRGSSKSLIQISFFQVENNIERQTLFQIFSRLYKETICVHLSIT